MSRTVTACRDKCLRGESRAGVRGAYLVNLVLAILDDGEMWHLICHPQLCVGL